MILQSLKKRFIDRFSGKNVLYESKEEYYESRIHLLIVEAMVVKGLQTLPFTPVWVQPDGRKADIRLPDFETIRKAASFNYRKTMTSMQYHLEVLFQKTKLWNKKCILQLHLLGDQPVGLCYEISGINLLNGLPVKEMLEILNTFMSADNAVALTNKMDMKEGGTAMFVCEDWLLQVNIDFKLHLLFLSTHPEYTACLQCFAKESN